MTRVNFTLTVFLVAREEVKVTNTSSFDTTELQGLSENTLPVRTQHNKLRSECIHVTNGFECLCAARRAAAAGERRELTARLLAVEAAAARVVRLRRLAAAHAVVAAVDVEARPAR